MVVGPLATGATRGRTLTSAIQVLCCVIAIQFASCTDDPLALDAEDYRVLIRGEGFWSPGGWFLEFQLQHNGDVSGWGCRSSGSCQDPRDTRCPETQLTATEHRELTSLLNKGRVMRHETDIPIIDADQVEFTVELRNEHGPGNHFKYHPRTKPADEALDMAVELAADIIARCASSARTHASIRTSGR